MSDYQLPFGMKGVPDMVTEQATAPYASGKAVVDVIHRYRERNLPDPVTQETMEQIGVSTSMSGVTLNALRFLGLLDEGGYKTEAFERLKRATTDEYPEQLAEVIRKAYMPVFTVVDPSADGDIAVADAFRRYEPSNQREKMIRLFRALCAEAGIIETPRKRRSDAKNPSQPRRKASQSEKPQTPPAPARDVTDQIELRRGGIDLRLISAIVQQLPTDGQWTSARRSHWLGAMESAVDLLVTVTDDERDNGEEGNTDTTE